MFAVGSSAQIYLYNQDVDMRKSFDALLGIVQLEFRRDIRLGDYFLFLNKRRDRVKILWWDRDGLSLFLKRLERGTFERPVTAADSKHLVIDAAQLTMLLSGIEISQIKRRPRYEAKPTQFV